MEDYTTESELDDFHAFAHERLNNGGRDLSLDELYDEWRLNNPIESELRVNAKAVSASLADLERGESGMEATQFVDEFKHKNGIK